MKIKTGKRIFVLLTAILVSAMLLGCSTSTEQQTKTSAMKTVSVTPDKQSGASEEQGFSDITIPISELTQTPRFYAAEANGIDLEVVALMASDGSVRTAFNTCQVCYSSGRGYYKLEGDELVCQNCGNRFTGDAVGVLSGGCNPVPITTVDRVEQDGVITIPGNLLDEARNILNSWK